MMRQALRAESDRAIESSLFAAWARKRKLAVSDAEVDAALGRIAAEQKLTVDELWAAAEAAGYARALYRDEVRRQLVEQRLLYSGPFGRLGPPPPAGQALTTWFTRRRAQLLADLKRRACVERFGRF